MTASAMATRRLPNVAFTCGLCGSRFSHGVESCHSCVLASGCQLVRCPGCGYQFPRSSRIVDWVRRLARRWRGNRS